MSIEKNEFIYTFRVKIFNSTKLVLTDSKGIIKDDFTRIGCFKKYLAFIRKLYGYENIFFELIKTKKTHGK
jgi:hypothetical protein